MQEAVPNIWEEQREIRRKLNKIQHRIAIMSGKGGVGKSTVTALLAVSLAKRGYSVGILDADILGPSIPKIFGLKKPEKIMIDTESVYPIESSRYKIRIMSMQFFLPEENMAVVWRGALVGRAIIDFLKSVEWGDLDYLLIDLPPGTGDASLTVMNHADLEGIIMVSTPQELTAFIVEKALDMAKKVGTKVLGVVENMSYFKCPNCGEVVNIGKDAAEKLCEKYNLSLIAKIPMDIKITRMCDEGRIEEVEEDYFKDFKL